jgi:hypothetical protein
MNDLIIQILSLVVATTSLGAYLRGRIEGVITRVDCLEMRLEKHLNEALKVHDRISRLEALTYHPPNPEGENRACASHSPPP